jgi:diacylglycerol kinase family enzyme
VKHLFVINPTAAKVKGKTVAVMDSVRRFFKDYPHLEYDIYVTQWERDALAAVSLKAAKADELLRVHVMGGSGTLYEVVNGTVNIPNVQVAAYPFGAENNLLHYFGSDRLPLFSSIKSQVFSDTIPLDVLRCGHRYGVSYGLVGLEAAADRDGNSMKEKNKLMDNSFTYLWASTKIAFETWKEEQAYTVELDGKSLDGSYMSMLIANGPVYAKNMAPAIDAHPNDGLLNVYLIKKMPGLTFFYAMHKYLSGKYAQLPDYISHHTGTKISIASNSIMCITIDGQFFHDKAIEYEALPYAVDFVCPDGIDVNKLPRIYGKDNAITLTETG